MLPIRKWCVTVWYKVISLKSRDIAHFMEVMADDKFAKYIRDLKDPTYKITSADCRKCAEVRPTCTIVVQRKGQQPKILQGGGLNNWQMIELQFLLERKMVYRISNTIIRFLSNRTTMQSIIQPTWYEPQVNLLQLRRNIPWDLEDYDKEIQRYVKAVGDRWEVLWVEEKTDAEQVIEVYLHISLHLISN